MIRNRIAGQLLYTVVRRAVHTRRLTATVTGRYGARGTHKSLHSRARIRSFFAFVIDVGVGLVREWGGEGGRGARETEERWVEQDRGSGVEKNGSLERKGVGAGEEGGGALPTRHGRGGVTMHALVQGADK